MARFRTDVADEEMPAIEFLPFVLYVESTTEGSSLPRKVDHLLTPSFLSAFTQSV